MAEWINNDGLRVWLGNTEAEVTRAGETTNYGGDRVWEFILDLTDLGTASALVDDSRSTPIPSGVFWSEVEVMTEIAVTSGGLAVLNLGLVRQDTTTAYDADGFLAAAPLADFNAAGETIVYKIGVTGVGAFIGTSTANAGFLVADYDTAAFTAGRLRIRLKGHVVHPNESN